MTKWFYEKNEELINSPVNKTFDELLICTDNEFRRWVIDLRKTVVDLWDNKGLPPRVGYNEKEVIENFKDMITYPVHELEVAPDVIRNTSVVGNAVNQFFPTMMKTKISYSSKGQPRSIYDYFADDSLLETFVTYARRHFRRDSFYHYSAPISEGDIIDVGYGPYKISGAESFANYMKGKTDKWDYWLCPVKEDKKYTGYNVELAKKKNLFVSADFDAPKTSKTNVDESISNKYSLRLYKKGQKLFPIGLKAFRVSFCQYAVNFPPLTARYLYERFTKHIPKDQKVIIYDPSMGWGGRLLGALSVNDAWDIHYVGTDPNTDHDTHNGRRKYHEFADFFNENVRHSGSLFAKSHTYETFKLGSEVIGNDKNFQKYKGKLDLVFTSPPYFNKEVYSSDPEQSCHKFSSYDSWRDGFLRPTLTTAVEYLRSNRYLLWNISDIVLDGKSLPLERDSCEILRELGMEYITTLKMTLAAMPGGNRTQDTGDTKTVITQTVFGEEIEEEKIVTGMMKNFVFIPSKKGNNKMMLKYEPIFVFRKP